MTARFGTKDLPMHAHSAYPERKSFVSRIAMQFADIFSQVSSHRFRAINDYTITNGLIPLMALHTGQGERTNETRVTISFGKDLTQNAIDLSNIHLTSPRFFCIQDSSEEDSEEAARILHEFFESYFPLPAPWEDPIFLASKTPQKLKKNLIRNKDTKKK